MSFPNSVVRCLLKRAQTLPARGMISILGEKDVSALIPCVDGFGSGVGCLSLYRQDFGTCTFLFQADTGGLEVEDPVSYFQILA